MAKAENLLALFKEPRLEECSIHQGQPEEHGDVQVGTATGFATPRLSSPTDTSIKQNPVRHAPVQPQTVNSKTSLPRTTTKALATPHSKSTFYDTPITDGPWDPAKYRKAKRVSESHVKTAHAQSDNIDNRPSLQALTSPQASRISKEDQQTFSKAIPFVTDQQIHSKALETRGQGLAHSTSQSTTSTVHSSGVTLEAPDSAKPVAIPTPSIHSNSLSLHLNTPPSRSYVLESSSFRKQATLPVTQGRPLQKPQNQPLSEAIMSHSQQANTLSPSSAAAHPGESPADHLKRLQRVKMMEHNLKSRRNHKHDTASPEVLTYIRKPLDPRINAMVEHRVAHYWQVGNENLPATDSIGVEPDWPAGSYDLDVKSNRFSRKRAKEPTLAPTVQANSPVISRKPSPWVTNAEVRAPAQHPNSNAWGSGESSGTDASDSDSVRTEGGRPRDEVKVNIPVPYEPGLLGWDGKMQPPPVDWHDRPRFDNTTIHYNNHFSNWCEAMVGSIGFCTIDPKMVLDVSNHPDGLGFVPADTSITPANMAYYGYAGGKEFTDLIKSTVPITMDDFANVNTVDIDDLTTLVDETTEYLVQRWIGQHGWLNNKHLPTRKNSIMLAPPSHYSAPTASEAPKMRISLRPAVVSDIPGLTHIYNWYVENSFKTTEFISISDSDMRSRLEDVRSSKLPFIVAVARNRGRGSCEDSRQPEVRRPNVNSQAVNGHPVTNNNPYYQGMTHEETILGWACASDMTASDYVERISAECELYVAHDARQLGVGKALMDKLFEACDRGHMKMGKYDWRCAPEFQHLYTGGGGRDLHKMYFVVRKWNAPEKVITNGASHKRHRAASEDVKVCDQEDEYEVWLKTWMESWGFEEEGVLKKVGTKDGRFLDVVYMGRETTWQPEEGRIPDPLPGSY